MVTRVLETVEGLAKPQIAENIEYRIVEPRTHVDFCVHSSLLSITGNDLAQPFDEKVDISMQYRLLGSKGACGEPGS